ncbi:Uncharacterised protein [Mycobacterium tuberculosis]|nr:Uncharacterised protein [Mycobacterium tuberculosis]CPC01752.1 Uncharacterised protein [Mycobacterium tuberculosis]
MSGPVTTAVGVITKVARSSEATDRSTKTLTR